MLRHKEIGGLGSQRAASLLGLRRKAEPWTAVDFSPRKSHLPKLHSKSGRGRKAHQGATQVEYIFKCFTCSFQIFLT